MELTELICSAISNKSLLSFNYDGGLRKVIPHCFGISTAGNPTLRAFQIKGFSRSGQPVHWKLFNMDLANAIEILDEQFENPKEGYKRGDSQMQKIFCEV